MTTALKKIACGLLLAAAGGFAYIHLQGPHGIPALRDKYHAIQEVEEQNRLLKLENSQLRQRNEDLKQPEVIEMEIRRRLHKLRKGEKDFKIPEQAPAK
jgi:cell division protein FtsB